MSDLTELAPTVETLKAKAPAFINNDVYINYFNTTSTNSVTITFDGTSTHISGIIVGDLNTDSPICVVFSLKEAVVLTGSDVTCTCDQVSSITMSTSVNWNTGFVITRGGAVTISY